MKILAIAPSLNVGGIGRHLLVFAKSFAEMGHDVTYLSCINHDEFYDPPKTINLVKPAFNNKGKLGRVFYYLRLTVYMRRLIKSIRPDFVIVFGELFNPLALIAAKGLNIPVFIGDMTSADYNFGKVKQFLRDLTYTWSAGLVCQTQFAEVYKKKQFGPKLNTIAIDNPIRDVIIDNNVEKEKVVLYVGRFAWEKAPDRIIRAFAKIKNHQDWRLIMCGDGPLIDENINLASELGISNRVDFLGKVKNVDHYMSLASIYVLPSILEGFPNALAEAMIAGLPVIVFDGFPSNEIVEDRISGIILRNGDIDALSKEIENLMSNPSLRQKLGENATEIRQRLDAKTVTKKLLEFIESSLKQKG
ncbi:MAG: glycosyltransferase [Bacteroidia bacterium]